MIRVKNHVGEINISQEYFMSLISNTVTNCFGVVQMNVSNAKQTLMAYLPKKKDAKNAPCGVSVRVGKDKLVVDLHITVMYGVNVSAVVKSIMNKVRYTIEESTGISVERVNVYVDGIRT
ncbi:MAG: Asp23/Gls24 family envelope stress response protein [Oscillospiraceae bacterium]|nr:Asp23/Gls24 family envelope stress response protein [Oscillospiraceae bacterium]